MAKNKASSRHGKIPDGWGGQGLQLPKSMVKKFREESAEFGHGGVKVLGTAAIAIVLALDEKDREILCDYVWQKTRSDVADLQEDRVLQLLKMLLGNADQEIPVVQPIWYVDKIKKDEDQ